jgi:hypothetical protein
MPRNCMCLSPRTMSMTWRAPPQVVHLPPNGDSNTKLAQFVAWNSSRALRQLNLNRWCLIHMIHCLGLNLLRIQGRMGVWLCESRMSFLSFFSLHLFFVLRESTCIFFLVVDVDMKRFIVPGQWVHQQNEIQWTTATSQDYEREQASRWERGRFRGV